MPQGGCCCCLLPSRLVWCACVSPANCTGFAMLPDVTPDWSTPTAASTVRGEHVKTQHLITAMLLPALFGATPTA
eukprot:377895-Pelagomonas_calceolata.AAC.13